jgi:SH3 domain protein
MMSLNKRTLIFFFLFSIVLIITAALPSWADTRYVSDQLIISVREGRSPEDTAVAYIVAGMPVEVLEEVENHLFVRIANGQEGWVKKKYILVQRPKSMVIEELKVKIQELENQIESQGSPSGTASKDSSDMRKNYDLKIKNLEAVLEKEKQSSTATRAELKQMKNQHKKLRDDFNKLSKQNDSLSKPNDGSETLNLEIKRLQQANLALNQEIDQIKTNGQPSMLSGGVKWFLTGGGVLLLGIILGRSVRRKNPYSY